MSPQGKVFVLFLASIAALFLVGLLYCLRERFSLPERYRRAVCEWHAIQHLILARETSRHGDKNWSLKAAYEDQENVERRIERLRQKLLIRGYDPETL
ncbi:MAG: hypothetical protein G01um101425_900 [Candidatus Peregrinibacteria bacterium Gr01-1014_25]|nr:MAG: hypothetical protein G01um101425_900 [Candidatus Peregrinibacteria bacterium Gr01-1014_25]